MLPSGPILDQLFEDTNATTPEKQASVLRRLNLSYFDIARKLSWEGLRRSITLTFAGDEAGVLLPSNLCGIDALTDDENDIFFQPRSKWQIAPDSDQAYRYAIVSESTDAMTRGTCSIAKRSNAVTGLAAGAAGEYIMFDKRFGIYKLATDATISVTFFEESLQTGGYAIRPAGTKRIAAYDRDGTLMSGTAVLDYWELPQPITDPAVPLVFPASDALMIHTIMRHVGLNNMDEKKADSYRREFYEAYESMASLNPVYITPAAPMDLFGNGGNLYGSLRP